MSDYAVAFEDVLSASKRLAGVVHRTPVMSCAALDAFSGRRLFFKCEMFQRAGAFKFRGAASAVARLDRAAADKGVVTHSSGNHAQALALAARQRGIPAWIVMPRTALPVKRRAAEGYGGIVVECGPTAFDREAAAREVVERTGGTLIPPFDHPDVIAGQGTAALELLEECPDLDAIVAPVGGGGLISGTAIVAGGVCPGLRVFGAEPRGADDAARSKAAGQWLPQTAPRTIADGLLTSTGQLTWPIIRDKVERIITVEEEEIVAAMRLLWERAKLLAEPSAAVAAAAVLTAEFQALTGLKRVGVILSGGNADLDNLPWR